VGIAGVFAGDGVENQLVGDRGAVLRLKSESLVKRSLGLLKAALVDLGDGLSDE